MLPLAFFLTALVYAAVGFAGGSTYNALLVVAGVNFRVLPTVSLMCNLLVSGGGAWRFARAKLVPWRRLLPLLLAAAPAAAIGGALPVPKPVFVALLGGTLLVSGLLLLVAPAPREREDAHFRLAGPAIAAPIGLLSGIVGIGGGIFLAPVLHLIGWARTRAVAASATVFILVNSLAGLAGQATRLTPADARAVAAHWPLALAVVVGGQIGSRVGAGPLPPAWLRRLTGVLVLAVAVRLLA